MHLNELEKSMEGVIPLTDSRLRPDIRAMENGDIGEVYDIGLVFFWHTSLKTICGDIQVFYICALLYRFGKCREEETWGKTENGTEKPHQIIRGLENKVSHRVIGCNAITLMICFLLIASLIVLFCQLCCPLYYTWEGMLHLAQGLVQSFALLLLFSLVWSAALHHTALLRTKCTTATVCLSRLWQSRRCWCSILDNWFWTRKNCVMQSVRVLTCPCFP